MTSGTDTVDLDSDRASPRPRISLQGLIRSGRDVAFLVLMMFALVWVYVWVTSAIGDGAIGFDFEGTLWDAAIAIREGRSPYPAPLVSEVDVGNPALYPPLLMLLVVPLTVVPWSIGVAFWLGVLGAAVAGALYILGVRDPRCYVLALVSAPVVNGLIWGNVTLLLVLLVALAWYWRQHWIRSGVLVGLAIAAKLFLWPLLFWLLGTRRYRAFGVGLAAAGAGVLLPWAVIGFDGFSSYPDLLRAAEEFYATHGYSIATMLSALGVGTGLATYGSLAVGVVLAAVTFVAGRRYTDEAAISLAVLAAVLGSPILWEYYYALLLVPLAIVRRRFSWLWLVLPLFYFTHRLPRPRLLSTAIEPGGFACCKPDDVPLSSWVFNHAPPGLWPALAHAVLAVAIIAVVVRLPRPASKAAA